METVTEPKQRKKLIYNSESTSYGTEEIIIPSGLSDNLIDEFSYVLKNVSISYTTITNNLNKAC